MYKCALGFIESCFRSQSTRGACFNCCAANKNYFWMRLDVLWGLYRLRALQWQMLGIIILLTCCYQMETQRETGSRGEGGWRKRCLLGTDIFRGLLSIQCQLVFRFIENLYLNLSDLKNVHYTQNYERQCFVLIFLISVDLPPPIGSRVTWLTILSNETDLWRLSDYISMACCALGSLLKNGGILHIRAQELKYTGKQIVFQQASKIREFG